MAGGSFSFAAVSSVSTDGCSARVRLCWGGSDSTDNAGYWFFYVFFCLLFYCCFWNGWCVSGGSGNGTSVFDNGSVLFCSGGSGVGKVSSSGQFVLWERATGFYGYLQSCMVELRYPLFLCVVGWCLCGFVLYAQNSAVGVKTIFVLSFLGRRN